MLEVIKNCKKKKKQTQQEHFVLHLDYLLLGLQAWPR